MNESFKGPDKIIMAIVMKNNAPRGDDISSFTKIGETFIVQSLSVKNNMTYYNVYDFNQNRSYDIAAEDVLRVFSRYLK
jgi:hypothetical protein